MDAGLVSKSVSELRRVSWDEPYRWFASALALAAVASSPSAPRAFGTLAKCADWLGAGTVAEFLLAIDRWLLTHAGVQGAWSVLATLALVAVLRLVDIGVAAAENRSGATLLVCWVLATYTPQGARCVMWAALVAAAGQMVRLRWFPSETSREPGEWFLFASAGVVVSLLYLPIRVLLWLFDTDRHVVPPPAPIPTGAVR